MNPSEWIKVISLVVDLLKTVIPTVLIFIVFWLLRKELKSFIRNGGWKVSGPGISFEASHRQ